MGVFWNHHHPENVSARLPQGMRRTNNVAEIQAVIEAIKIAKVRSSKTFKTYSHNSTTVRAHLYYVTQVTQPCDISHMTI